MMVVGIWELQSKERRMFSKLQMGAALVGLGPKSAFFCRWPAINIKKNNCNSPHAGWAEGVCSPPPLERTDFRSAEVRKSSHSLEIWWVMGIVVHEGH